MLVISYPSLNILFDITYIIKACFVSSAIAGGKSCDEATGFALRYVEDGALEAEVILVLDTIAQVSRTLSFLLLSDINLHSL